MKDVKNICVKDKDMDLVRLGEIFDIIKQKKSFWKSVEDYLQCCYNGEDSITFLSWSGIWDLDGNSQALGREVVSFDEWYDLVMLELKFPTQEGWVTWHGGANPVGDAQVMVILRMNHLSDIDMGTSFRWSHTDGIGDIVKYKLMREEKSMSDAERSNMPTKKLVLNIDIESAAPGNPLAVSAVAHTAQPRYRKRRCQKQGKAKTVVRVLYVTQQTYTFKNVLSVQVLDGKVYITYTKEVAKGITETSEVEIDGNLLMAVVIHEPDNRSNFFRNIDGTWDFNNEDGTVVNGGHQLGRIFK